MSICCFAKAQSISQGFTGNMVVNTEGGNRFELSFYNHKGADVVSICDWYRNLGQVICIFPLLVIVFLLLSLI